MKLRDSTVPYCTACNIRQIQFEVQLHAQLSTPPQVPPILALGSSPIERISPECTDASVKGRKGLHRSCCTACYGTRQHRGEIFLHPRDSSLDCSTAPSTTGNNNMIIPYLLRTVSPSSTAQHDYCTTFKLVPEHLSLPGAAQL